jgi:hypothetical protein
MLFIKKKKTKKKWGDALAEGGSPRGGWGWPTTTPNFLWGPPLRVAFKQAPMSGGSQATTEMANGGL